MDREKVVKGLECHRIDNNHRINCADCPYYVDDDNHIRCVNDLHDDAIALLKKQKARLYIFDELDHLPNEVDIWCEIKGEDRIFAQTTYDMWFSPYGKFRNAVWNKEIRYWTTRPSKKERKLVGWDA